MKGLDPDTGKTKEEFLRDELIKLQAENRRLKEELQHRDNVNTGMVSTLYGKPFEYWFGLQAVVDAAKVVGEERGIHRYYKPMDVAIDAMLDAIKEVVK